MFIRRSLSVVFILFFSAGISLAQEGNKIGIGVAAVDVQKMFEADMTPGGGTYSAITVPIILSPAFRLEPEIGYFNASQKASINGTTYEESVTSWTIGAGIFPQKEYEKFTIYYGGRVGYISQKATSEAGANKNEETSSGFYIAPAIGGEHNFSDHFSIGAEAQFVYASMTNKDDNRSYDVDIALIDTRGLIFFRFYF